MFDCRGFRKFKKIFIIVLAVLSLVFILMIIFFCKKVLNKKMETQLNLKVNEAIQKYLTVDKA